MHQVFLALASFEFKTYGDKPVDKQGAKPGYKPGDKKGDKKGDKSVN